MKHVEAFLRAGLVLLFFMLALPIAQANEEIPAEWYGTQPDVYALYSRDTAGDNSYAFTPSPEQWRDRNIYQLFTDRFATDGGAFARSEIASSGTPSARAHETIAERAARFCRRRALWVARSDSLPQFGQRRPPSSADRHIKRPGGRRLDRL